jgi:hypothetical protein
VPRVRQASSGHFGRYFAGYFETIPALKAMVTAIGNDYIELCSNVSTRTALEPPVDLVADAIKDCSRRGTIILDPFGGSGTTIIAARISANSGRVSPMRRKMADRTSSLLSWRDRKRKSKNADKRRQTSRTILPRV